MKRPTLYLMLGYPGAGKTTAARVIHELTGAVHLWADAIRRERYKVPTHTHKENLELYASLNEMTGKLLSEGKSVIFDTNFNFYKDRQHLREIAAEHKATSILLWVVTPKDIARKRATQNAHNQSTRVLGNMPVAHFERMSGNLQPPRPDEHNITIDGTKITPDYIRTLLEV